MRLELINNSTRKATAVVYEGQSSVPVSTVLAAACNKFRISAKQARLFFRGLEQQADASLPLSEAGGTVWVVHGKEQYRGPAAEQFQSEDSCRDSVTVLDGADVWIDPEAVKQVHETVLRAAGAIIRAVCLPDLHHGPTGVAILARNPMPKLPGYDIGCGMGLFRTNIPATISRDKVARCMARLNLDTGEHPADPQLGTIGGGNHFAELLVLDPSVHMSPEVQPLLSHRNAVLLVHSGSRGHGQRVFSEHSGGQDPEGYMREHEELVGWARRNRAEIARRFLQQFAGARPCEAGQHGGAAAGAPTQGEAEGEGEGGGATDDGTRVHGSQHELTAVVDMAHNWIEQLPDGMFLHRKGAAPSHVGSLSLLPGSRATASYVLVCNGSHGRDLNSLAHGAGRRLSRADARRKGADGGGSGGDLTRGGTVVCESKDLLLEEAPHAYKDVEAVVACMVERGMCSVGARLLPIATYKTRNQDPSQGAAHS